MKVKYIAYVVRNEADGKLGVYANKQAAIHHAVEVNQKYGGEQTTVEIVECSTLSELETVVEDTLGELADLYRVNGGDQ